MNTLFENSNFDSDFWCPILLYLYKMKKVKAFYI